MPKALFRQAAKIQCFGISDSNPFSCFVCRLNSEKTHMKSDVYKVIQTPSNPIKKYFFGTHPICVCRHNVYVTSHKSVQYSLQLCPNALYNARMSELISSICMNVPCDFSSAVRCCDGREQRQHFQVFHPL